MKEKPEQKSLPSPNLSTVKKEENEAITNLILKPLMIYSEEEIFDDGNDSQEIKTSETITHSPVAFKFPDRKVRFGAKISNLNVNGQKTKGEFSNTDIKNTNNELEQEREITSDIKLTSNKEKNTSLQFKLVEETTAKKSGIINIKLAVNVNSFPVKGSFLSEVLQYI